MLHAKKKSHLLLLLLLLLLLNHMSVLKFNKIKPLLFCGYDTKILSNVKCQQTPENSHKQPQESFFNNRKTKDTKTVSNILGLLLQIIQKIQK